MPSNNPDPTGTLTGAENKKPVVLLVGPTAVGKTEVAIQLAQQLNAEIVSADSRLFYRGMDIGTAKPTPAERAGVLHHLIDIADPDEILSLAVFQEKATQAIHEIHARQRLPLVVGGTGQYMRAVAEGWTPPAVEPEPKLRLELEQLANQRGSYWLHEKLAGMDADAAQAIDPRNLRRTVRALEVILTTGQKFSAQRRQIESPYLLTTLGLSRPRPELYERVDQRIEQMFENGFLGEVQTLLDQGYDPGLPTLSAIGYRECIRVLKGEWTEEQAKAEIRRATRIFVRRQANWFKESDPNISWFSVEAGVVEKIGAHIRSAL